MRLNELFYRGNSNLVEAPRKPVGPEYNEVKYGTWSIKYRTQAKNGEFSARGFNIRNPNQPSAVGSTPDEAVANTKKLIDRYMAMDDLAAKAASASIAYNADFTKQILAETGVTGVRLVRNGGDVYLIIAGVEYIEAFGNEAFGTGPDSFTKLSPRKPEKELGDVSAATTVYKSSLTMNQIRTLGLQRNGRYALEQDHTDLDYGHQYFKLVFDSVTAGPTDRKPLNSPGLTVAVF